jgi:hypothetical protein
MSRSDFACDCGADYGPEVAAKGYPAFHAGRKWINECCAADCEKRCCHACATVCRICGEQYCPEHSQGFHRDLKLCSDCAAEYAEMRETPTRGRLIEIEARMKSGAGFQSHGNHYRGASDLYGDMCWLLENLKDVLVDLADLQRRRPRLEVR